jgi:hypothetical protein
MKTSLYILLSLSLISCGGDSKKNLADMSAPQTDIMIIDSMVVDMMAVDQGQEDQGQSDMAVQESDMSLDGGASDMSMVNDMVASDMTVAGDMAVATDMTTATDM